MHATVAIIYVCYYVLYTSYYGTYVEVYSLFIGIALIEVVPVAGGNALVSANSLTNYSYVNARNGTITQGVQIARCVTGLGPSVSDDNYAVGGMDFHGNKIHNGRCTDSFSAIVQPRPALLQSLGVINIQQCREFSTSVEGIYTCIMMKSSMMNESLSFGVYFSGRCESPHLYIYPIT